ncbi:hypothetical protein BB561_000612 [Smittium simulii]|uniref:Cysteine-rich protein 1 n=1 Tax=Smittium simulii TaxID=133385 RepID=A0A2T9YYE6_9FUNG|nr:hypothetical protein BB561_000612 [Smittium simulii]
MERRVAIKAVETASEVCKKVLSSLVNSDTLIKKDKSPVTVADFSSQAIINKILYEHFPRDPIVGEEDSRELLQEKSRTTLKNITELTNSIMEEQMTSEQILESIDRGNYPGGPKGRHWTLDPIDGTLGFLRKEQFAVCLALIEDGQVKLGVIGCPNLPYISDNGEHDSGSLFVAVKGQGAFQRGLKTAKAEARIHVSSCSDTSLATFTESVESSHSSHTTAEKIAQLLNITKPSVRMDSQCKYGVIARGQADIYLRIPTSKTYIEKIWDHASGNLLVEEAGGIVTDVFGSPLDFSVGRTLAKNKGVIATNKFIHNSVLDSIIGPEGSWHKRCFRCKTCLKSLSSANLQEKNKEVADNTLNLNHKINDLAKTYIKDTSKQENIGIPSTDPIKYIPYTPSSIFSRGNAKLNIPKPKDICPRCSKTVFDAEKVVGPNGLWHRACLKCKSCNSYLNSGKFSDRNGEAYCTKCYNRLWGPKGLNFTSKTPENQASNSLENDNIPSNSSVISTSKPELNQNSYIISPTKKACPSYYNTYAQSTISNRTNLLNDNCNDTNTPDNSAKIPLDSNHPIPSSNSCALSESKHDSELELSRRFSDIAFAGESEGNASGLRSFNTKTRYSEFITPSQNQHTSPYYRRASNTAKAPIFNIQADICPRCQKRIYAAEMATFVGKKFHKLCVTCYNCHKHINTSNMSDREGEIYCNMCYGRLYGPKGLKIRHGEIYNIN